MALAPEQQAIELIMRAKRILIVSKDHAAIDALASVGACLAFLTKLGKAADAVIPGTYTTTVWLAGATAKYRF